jgi:hypothetical protein
MGDECIAAFETDPTAQPHGTGISAASSLAPSSVRQLNNDIRAWVQT